MEACKPRASPTAETARGRHFDSGINVAPLSATLTTKTNFNREDIMRSIASMTLAACAIALMSSSSLAQTPAPATPPAPPSAGGTPDAMPFDIPYGLSIGLEHAKQVMAAAEAEAKKRNWKM